MHPRGNWKSSPGLFASALASRLENGHLSLPALPGTCHGPGPLHLLGFTICESAQCVPHSLPAPPHPWGFSASPGLKKCPLVWRPQGEHSRAARGYEHVTVSHPCCHSRSLLRLSQLRASTAMGPACQPEPMLPLHPWPPPPRPPQSQIHGVHYPHRCYRCALSPQ